MPIFSNPNTSEPRMKKTCSFIVVAALALAVALPTAAQDEGTLSGYLADFKADFTQVSKKLADLAEATPADKYGWQPAEGVRTISEVYIHVALANYFLASSFGVPMPEGVGQDAEQTITAKDAVIAALKESQKHVHMAVEKAAQMDLDEEVNVFGAMRTRRTVLMIIGGHSHEHLGQSIAYARSNNIAPPWSGGGEGSQ